MSDTACPSRLAECATLSYRLPLRAIFVHGLTDRVCLRCRRHADELKAPRVHKADGAHFAPAPQDSWSASSCVQPVVSTTAITTGIDQRRISAQCPKWRPCPARGAAVRPGSLRRSASGTHAVASSERPRRQSSAPVNGRAGVASEAHPVNGARLVFGANWTCQHVEHDRT